MSGARIDRVERVMTLLANLLDTRTPLSFEEVVERVPGYPTESASARRQFERDKDLLRRIGVVVSVIQRDPLDDNDVGYRVRPEDYYLPDLDLTSEERIALHAAVTAVDLQGAKGREALLKLGGGEGNAAPRLAALPWAPELPALLEATRARSPVMFTYRSESRTVDPYSVLSRNGHWYVIGFDHGRGEPRAFRVDRIETNVEIGPASAFEPPPDFDPNAVLGTEPWKYGDEAVITAEVLVDAPYAAFATRQVSEDEVERLDDGSVLLRLKVTNRDALRAFVAGFLEHAEVVGPPAVREEMIEWLEAIAGGDGADGAGGAP